MSVNCDANFFDEKSHRDIALIFSTLKLTDHYSSIDL